jgi:hypothetical protein
MSAGCGGIKHVPRVDASAELDAPTEKQPAVDAGPLDTEASSPDTAADTVGPDRAGPLDTEASSPDTAVDTVGPDRAGPADMEASSPDIAVDTVGPDGAHDAGCPVVFDGGIDPPTPDAGASDIAISATRNLIRVVEGGPWRTVQEAAALAVDSQGRVFVADNDQIHMVQGSGVSLYLTIADARAAVGPQFSDTSFRDFDSGPDDQLYILTERYLLKSAAAREAIAWHELAADVVYVGTRPRISVIAADDVLFIRREGMSRASWCGVKPVYSLERVHGATECTTEDLAVGPTGTFFYQSGCNGHPLYRGQADGSGVQLMYETSLFRSNPLNATGFLCLARDPAGGFYVVVWDSWNNTGAHLFHLTEDALGSRGVTKIPTQPSFQEAERAQSELFAFEFCSVAVARDGTVFFQTRSQLWKVTP